MSLRSSAMLPAPAQTWCCQVIRCVRSPLTSMALGNSYVSDHIKKKKFILNMFFSNSKNSSQLCWCQPGCAHFRGCSSISRLLIPMHTLVTPYSLLGWLYIFTQQIFSFCRREIFWHTTPKEPREPTLDDWWIWTPGLHRLEPAHRTAVAVLRSHRWLFGNYLPAWPVFLGFLELLDIKMPLNTSEPFVNVWKTSKTF